jgi:hypothetical protein
MMRLVLSCLIRATGWANAPREGGRLRCWLAAPLPLPQQWTCSAVQIVTRVPLSLYLGPRLAITHMKRRAAQRQPTGARRRSQGPSVAACGLASGRRDKQHVCRQLLPSNRISEDLTRRGCVAHQRVQWV